MLAKPASRGSNSWIAMKGAVHHHQLTRSLHPETTSYTPNRLVVNVFSSINFRGLGGGGGTLFRVGIFVVKVLQPEYRSPSMVHILSQHIAVWLLFFLGKKMLFVKQTATRRLSRGLNLPEVNLHTCTCPAAEQWPRSIGKCNLKADLIIFGSSQTGHVSFKVWLCPVFPINYI